MSGKAIMPAHSDEVERYSPAYIGEALNAFREPFDLDPATPDCAYPMRACALKTYSAQRGDDGLTLPWAGEVFLNPPWTKGVKRLWVMKLREHGSGIALVRGGIDSGWFQDAEAEAVFFIRGRVHYAAPEGVTDPVRKGNAKGGFEPSMLIAYGPRSRRRLEQIPEYSRQLQGRLYALV